MKKKITKRKHFHVSRSELADVIYFACLIISTVALLSIVIHLNGGYDRFDLPQSVVSP